MRSTEEKIKRKVISVVIIVAILSMMAGCGKSQSRKEPITLTIWHVYGGQTDSPLNDLIDGRKKRRYKNPGRDGI